MPKGERRGRRKKQFQLPLHESDPQCWLGHVSFQYKLLNSIVLSSEKISLFLRKKKKSAKHGNLLHWLLNVKAEKDHRLPPQSLISEAKKRSPGRPYPLDLTP